MPGTTPIAVARVLAAQGHEDFCPGLLEPWARARRVALDVVRSTAARRCPRVADAGAAVVLGSHASLGAGGPQTAALGPRRPWVAEALGRDVRVLGNGFGAQLVVAILGGESARVRRADAARALFDGWAAAAHLARQAPAAAAA